MADRLHDLARNSMDSVGVSGGGAHEISPQLAGSSSFMFSSLCDEFTGITDNQSKSLTALKGNKIKNFTFKKIGLLTFLW